MLDDIVDYLASEGLGTVSVDLFKESMPDTPDSCVAVYTYAGRPPQFEHDSPQPALRYPRLQVKCRDLHPVTAQGLAQDAYLALCEVVNLTLGGTMVLRIVPFQEPFSLGQDASLRWLYVCNYEVTL